MLLLPSFMSTTTAYRGSGRHGSSGGGSWIVVLAAAVVHLSVGLVDAAPNTASATPTAQPAKVTRDRPRNVTAEVVNTTNILLHWVAPRRGVNECDVSRYIIRYKTEENPRSMTRKVNGGKRSYVLTKLQSDTMYLIRIVAISCQGKSVPTRWVRVTTGTQGPRTSRRVMVDESRVPSMPRALRTRTSATSLVLSWEAPDDEVLVRGYVVGHGEGVPDVKWQYVDANTRSFTITDLRPATQYVISLRAFNNFGKGPVVYDIVYTRDDEAPTNGPLMPPIGLRSNVLSPHTVWLEWIDPSLGRNQQITDERYYVVNYKPVPYGSETTTTVKALNIVLYDLIPATTYEFRVKTIKGNEATVYGISVYNTTFDDAPGSPPTDFSLEPSENDARTVHLMWMPPVQPNGALTGYLVLMSEDPELPDREWTVDSIVSDRLSTTIGPLNPNVTYFFKIQARNNIGYGPHSDILHYRVGQRASVRHTQTQHNSGSAESAYLYQQQQQAGIQPTPPQDTETTTVFKIVFNEDGLPPQEQRPDIDLSNVAPPRPATAKYVNNNNNNNPAASSSSSGNNKHKNHDNNNNNSPHYHGVYPQPQDMEDGMQYEPPPTLSGGGGSSSSVGGGEGLLPNFNLPPSKSHKPSLSLEGAPRDTTPPVVFTTEIRHTVSALITWAPTSSRGRSCDHTDTDILLAGISPPTPVYKVEYHPDGKPELAVLVNTTKTAILLTGLQPDTRYRYTVSAYISSHTQAPQWSASDVLETNYKH